MGKLREIGIDALGIDSYIDQDQWVAGSVLVQKKQLNDVQSSFDPLPFITLLSASPILWRL